MTDVALRELERRWRASGTDEDRALWLVARVRAGRLAPERLSLAGYAGDVAARRASEDPAPPRTVPAWARGFARWGQEAHLRASLAAARSALPELLRGGNPNPEFPRLLAAAEAAALALDGPAPGRLRHHIDRAAHFAADDAGRAVLEAARAVLQASLGAPAIVAVTRTEEALRRAQRAVGLDILRDAVRDAVAPWALGERDPLARGRG